MANPAIEKLIESLDSDLPRSALFQKKIPALAEAFDAEGMKPILQESSLARQRSLFHCRMYSWKSALSAGPHHQHAIQAENPG